ncbi:mannosyl-glycoprotein endo-beta-N-acetylglucosaminidase [Hydrogenispora ethanolica]|jgi:flagellum-specific peptidoglycan hydrolase FlgJ|uniref:Mannosyl-glycoprotein endo-beta-N-acetylglucosaminidase n=1 Tax=Hydrogenispora ethanolica TaxID=1082276 RepID=A0A4V2QFE0_HYDET|nr:glucosaminidase domain-containing protein [Hydrogenispora ethanolica]TCL71577.1 mannosyl-glycoprotein endo-beta-N-acetylglucosaminidase [Hydrogenispora ethanolica]
MTKIEFIHQMAHACDKAHAQGARFNQAVVFAQAALESHWGNSDLAREANNIFSIKAGPTWDGPTFQLTAAEWHYQRGWYQAPALWRKYPDWTACIVDYAAIIAAVPWYQAALEHLDDPHRFLKALLPSPNKPGWATDPDYYGKVVRTGAEMESYGGPKWS